MIQNAGNIFIYNTTGSHTNFEMTLVNDTVWLTTEQIAQHYYHNKSTISRHIKNVLERSELQTDSVVPFFVTTINDRKTYNVVYNNLDMILFSSRDEKWLQKEIEVKLGSIDIFL